jgi:hypothetical protein
VTNIEQFIKNQGPMLSGQLAKAITDQDGITEEAARKRIERVDSPVHKLTGLFSERQSFIYHQDIYNSEEYFQGLAAAFETDGKRYAAIIKAIDYHHGVISKAELANYSISPLINMKGHLRYSSVIEKLSKTGVLINYDENHWQLNGYIAAKEAVNFRHYKAIEFSKHLLANNFNAWCRNIGFASFKKGDFNSSISGFQFTYTAPSYINGLTVFKNGTPQPGFIAADILIGNKTGVQEVNFFLQKIRIIKARTPSIRLLPVLLVDGLDVNALADLKRAGVMIASVKEIFGQVYDDLLKSLINTITNAGTVLKKEPEKYLNLMVQLSKLVDGKTNNLRGDLFELAVGYYYAQDCRYLEIGKKVRLEEEMLSREIDVFATYADKIVLVECKGYNYAIDDAYVLKFLNDKVPILKKWLDKSSFTQDDYVFEIWSTGGFTSEALTLLEKAKTTTKKYKIDYLDKPAILERAKALNTSKFVEILKEYFFKDL